MDSLQNETGSNIERTASLNVLKTTSGSTRQPGTYIWIYSVQIV